MYRSSHSERQRCSCPQGTSPHFLLICGPAEQWPYWCWSFLRCWEAIQLFSQEGGSEDTGISCAKVHISQITVAVGLVGFSYWSATGAIPREPAIIERHSGVLHTEDRFQGKWVNPRDAAMEIIIIIIIQFWIWQVDKGLCPETGWRHDGLMPPSREPGLPVLCDHGDCLLWLLSKVILMPPRWKVFKETFEMLIRSHPNLFFFFFFKKRASAKWLAVSHGKACRTRRGSGGKCRRQSNAAWTALGLSGVWSGQRPTRFSNIL